MRRPAAPPLVLGVGLFCLGLLGGLRVAGPGGTQPLVGSGAELAGLWLLGLAMAVLGLVAWLLLGQRAATAAGLLVLA
ncbi:MAG TPA: hypothetical protein VMK65_11060, partial [Longimicrobiales bacterium]|nr:hypothetical protein [Longimicrobiales bacterium]